jgi:choline dehydrogenase-like flavoprotein
VSFHLRNKQENKFYVTSKEKKQNKIFKLLKDNKIIYPFYKNLFPGYGADYHYFGTIPISKNKNNKLTVNENCQLNKHNNIYIVDGSVFNFSNNKYPLGLLMANARRIAAYIKK